MILSVFIHVLEGQTATILDRDIAFDLEDQEQDQDLHRDVGHPNGKQILFIGKIKVLDLWTER